MSRIDQLSSRKTGLDQLEPTWRLIEDVLAGRLKRRTPPNAQGLLPASYFQNPNSAWSSPYLPKGRLEPESEYSLRVELTPFFPETPRVLASRLGALLKNRPRVEHAESPAMQEFLTQAGRRHTRFEDLLAQAAHLSQIYGFCAALLDRDPLPPGTDVSTLSAAEAAQRKLGRPYLALYGAPEILDWEVGPDGELAWVKFGERCTDRARWDSAGEEVLVYRIVDREATQVFKVRRSPRPPFGGEGRASASETRGEGSAASKLRTPLTPGFASALSPERGERGNNSTTLIEDDWQISAEPPVPHGFSRVPVVFCHPFPGLDGIGRPLLARCAEADVAATRILSDLVWDLFLLGNPILTFKTSRPESELQRLGVGASRYIPLRNGTKEIPSEKLEFVQLDPTGLNMLFKAHRIFSDQATKQAGLSTGEATAIPAQQSGVARAWAFKTGEERLLFLLSRALEPFLTEALRLAAEGLGVSDAPVVQLPESFDVSGPAETIALAERAAKLSDLLKDKELANLAAKRAEEALNPLTD